MIKDNESRGLVITALFRVATECGRACNFFMLPADYSKSIKYDFHSISGKEESRRVIVRCDIVPFVI